MPERDDRPDVPEPDEQLTSPAEESTTPVDATVPSDDIDATEPVVVEPVVVEPVVVEPVAIELDGLQEDEFLAGPVVAGQPDEEDEAYAPWDPDDAPAGDEDVYDPEDLDRHDDLDPDAEPDPDTGQRSVPTPGADASESGLESGPESNSPRAFLVIAGVLVVLTALLAVVYLTSVGSDGPAFTVFEEETSRDELADRLDGLVPDDVLEALGEEDATPEQQAQLAQAISTLISLDVLNHAAEEEGITVTDADIEEQLAEVVATGFGGDQAAFDAQLEQAGVTPETVDAQFRTALLAERLVEDDVPEIEDAEIRAAYDAQFNLPTVSHILTESEEEAQAAKDRIDAGEEFGAVASEVSIDGSATQGGELGPLAPGQFVPEFEEGALALESGEVSDPVQTEFGFHIITVSDPVPFEEVAEQIEAALEQQGLGESFTALAEQLEADAAITVDPVLGTWTGLTGGGLVPPDAGGAVPDGGATAPDGG